MASTLTVDLHVRFEEQDVTTAAYPVDSFNGIYSRDCIMHLPVCAKEELFSKMFAWARPGARILITDYCRGLGEAVVRGQLERELALCPAAS